MYIEEVDSSHYNIYEGDNFHVTVRKYKNVHIIVERPKIDKSNFYIYEGIVDSASSVMRWPEHIYASETYYWVRLFSFIFRDGSLDNYRTAIGRQLETLERQTGRRLYWSDLLQRTNVDLVLYWVTQYFKNKPVSVYVNDKRSAVTIVVDVEGSYRVASSIDPTPYLYFTNVTVEMNRVSMIVLESGESLDELLKQLIKR